ncbi:DNA-directed RNA polymerase III subunit RPC1 [Piedraia hortae CBS 480.64]|uniref:DNA-directed RNA polymerase subunit n=1 Tax=Piedraia hortae CBS 480.64 TaxID=1314780 RepID=A0A6A7C1A9_9PEZI|nr:DNA-directed RNA polymerase III subunit RPC1 [Piedraia hortae CBS 480.64]
MGEQERKFAPEVKEQVLEALPKSLNALQFALLSPEHAISQSVLTVNDRDPYESPQPGQRTRPITKRGPIDDRLGISSKSATCKTCGQGLMECNGHFGHVKLSLPVFHYGYLKKVIEVLSCVCKECSQVLLSEQEKRAYLVQFRRPGMDSTRLKKASKTVTAACKKVKTCPHCGSLNGPIRKVPGHSLKLVHNKFASYLNSTAKNKQKPHEMVAFEQSFEEAKKSSPEIQKHMRRAVDDLTPLRVLNIFRKIPDVDVEVLGMNPYEDGRPENLLWTCVPAPPVAIRPSVQQETTTTEDYITNKLGDIIYASNFLSANLTAGKPLSTIMEIWEFLQVQVAIYIDGNVPGVPRDASTKAMRGFCQRLKGKQGRFRGNLSGKRVGFSGRTVISPDPNLSIDEVAVPSQVAMTLTYPERVTKHNLQKLRQRVLNRNLKHPGANSLVKTSTGRITILGSTKENMVAKAAADLRVGDVVERHLEDGDVVLFNRQPSLHKLSILAHRAKIRPWRTFRLNECVCNPYNADFDGDEMNLHLPQTESARTEAIELMGVKHNLATPKNGTPIIAAIQDFITCAYLISQKDQFFNRRQFCQIAGYMFPDMEVSDPVTRESYPIEIPPPSIIKPQALWTGKQVWSLLMKPYAQYPVNVNLDAKGKQYADPGDGLLPDMTLNDSYLVVRNSQVMCGALDKATVGDGKKDSVFFVIMRDFGPDYAVAAMNRLARLSARWLSEQAFSIGISDVYPSTALSLRKRREVQKGYDQCTDLISLLNQGKLQRDPGCDEEQTMEIRIAGILSRVRQSCGELCFQELSRHNSPATMAKCGSKGSNINVAQMVATVGQQILNQMRILNGFEDRTLPHFPKASRDPPSKGFVYNSFFSGLNPSEFIFHAMTGRDGLVDTAVKTADTGYMSRRLMKSLEDLSAQYDSTVRNSSEMVVQLKFGDDGLDPLDMEGSAKPVNFERTFMHAVTTTWSNEEKGIVTEDEAQRIVARTLEGEWAKLARYSDKGSQLHLHDTSDDGADQLESVRNFLVTLQSFVTGKIKEAINSQSRFQGGLPGKPSIFKISKAALDCFLNLCLRKFEKSKVEAGHAVGAVGAQSIGEPGTQMTLKTFHFAGVAGMSITQGVPRIKEIINASKTILTPVITCDLDSKYEEVAGRFAKAIIQKTYLEDIVDQVDDVWLGDSGYLNLRIDWRSVRDSGLHLTIHEVARAIQQSKIFKSGNVRAVPHGKSHIRLYCNSPNTSKSRDEREAESSQVFVQMQEYKRQLPSVVIKGFPDASRAILKKDDKCDASGKEPLRIYVEGYGLKLCMTTEGIDGHHTKTNSVIETLNVLGIEAARTVIINEISLVMGGMDIDPRHMQLLADVMTTTGEVLGITRHGLALSRESVLQLASFEQTPEHLFGAAIHRSKDEIKGVSESIIMGKPMNVGTGAARVIMPLDLRSTDVTESPAPIFANFAKGLMKTREARLTALGRKIGS